MPGVYGNMRGVGQLKGEKQAIRRAGLRHNSEHHQVEAHGEHQTSAVAGSAQPNDILGVSNCQRTATTTPLCTDDVFATLNVNDGPTSVDGCLLRSRDHG